MQQKNQPKQQMKLNTTDKQPRKHPKARIRVSNTQARSKQQTTTNKHTHTNKQSTTTKRNQKASTQRSNKKQKSIEKQVTQTSTQVIRNLYDYDDYA